MDEFKERAVIIRMLIWASTSSHLPRACLWKCNSSVFLASSLICDSKIRTRRLRQWMFSYRCCMRGYIKWNSNMLTRYGMDASLESTAKCSSRSCRSSVFSVVSKFLANKLPSMKTMVIQQKALYAPSPSQIASRDFRRRKEVLYEWYLFPRLLWPTLFPFRRVIISEFFASGLVITAPTEMQRLSGDTATSSRWPSVTKYDRTDIWIVLSLFSPEDNFKPIEVICNAIHSSLLTAMSDARFAYLIRSIHRWKRSGKLGLYFSRLMQLGEIPTAQAIVFFRLLDERERTIEYSEGDIHL